MNPTLTWLDLTSRDRDKMRGILDLFKEQGTIDELGLGSLRDAISDALFPGTSTIQTRLRYALFVPWIYRSLEGRRPDDIANTARKAEIDLIARLKESTDVEGIIGTSAGTTLARLPSSVYWAALVRWGIFPAGRSQSWYHQNFSEVTRRRSDVPRADDPGVIWSREPTWHPRLPAAPSTFPGKVDFALTKPEAEFFLGRIQERCPGTLLEWLARNGSKEPAGAFWDDATVKEAPAPILATVELARRFSLHVEGAPILYNLLLAERRKLQTGGDGGWIDAHRAGLERWAGQEADEAPFETTGLLSFMALRGARVPDPQRRFMEVWAERVRQIGAAAVADDPVLRALVEQRELKLKGKRARLANSARLLDWTGSAGLGRMGFRWYRVRQLLVDLHTGLEA